MTDTPSPPESMPQALQVVLDPASIRLWTDRAMQESLTVIACALPSLAAADVATPTIAGATITMNFPVTPAQAEVRRARCKLWLLTKGLHEIARAVRMALEEAYLYLGLVARFIDGDGHSGVIETASFNAEVLALKRKANGLNFPQLLDAVNSKLLTPLEFVEEYQSLNSVRNCLEHRDGLVGEIDAKDGGTLRLVLPCMEIVIRHADGTETPLVLGEMIAGGEVIYRRGRAVRTYVVGEMIAFDEKDFAEIAQCCFFFGADLVSKLPTNSVAADGS